MENTKSTTIEGKNVGKKCRTHYRGTFNDGTQFDSSYDRGEPLEFVCGAGMMIKGFDAAVASMEVGQTTEGHRFEPCRSHSSEKLMELNMARWLNWLERPVHTREVESSSLSLATIQACGHGSQAFCYIIKT